MTTQLPRRWGCFNRPGYGESLQVQDGWTEDGQRKMRVVPHVMTRDCQYSKEANDSKCDGCKWAGVVEKSLTEEGRSHDLG